MRLDNFDLNLLMAFEALMTERSVTRAADRLNVTQSAMSAALKRLRESFQDDILVQHGKKMIPTQHALALSQEVSSVLIRLKSLIASSTRFDPTTSKRRFRVVASDYITTVLIAPLVQSLQVEAPDVKLELSLPGTASTTQLEAGEIDLILTPDTFLEQDHPRELLFDENFVVVGAKDNPLIQEPISREAYLQGGHVVVRMANQPTFIEKALQSIVPERRIELTAQSFIQVPWLVSGTSHLSVMHERLARVSAPVFGLALVAAPFPLPKMPEMMQHHMARADDAGLAWLRRRMIEFAGKL